MAARNAQFVWSDPHGTGMNRYVLFRSTFRLQGKPASAVLHLFADTRYRLIVNGTVVAHGPGRFFVAKPEYDSHDIAPFLQDGANVIAVAVNSYGSYTYHSEYSHGGFIAWGTVEADDGSEVDVATPGEWRALDSPGHVPQTAHLSFVLNQGELLDGRLEAEGYGASGFDDSAWRPAVLLDDQDHWGRLVPRTIPLLDEREVLPRERTATWAAKPHRDEDGYSFITLIRDGRRWRDEAPTLALTYIHSPRAQSVVFGAWNGRFWVNGCEVEGARRGDLHMRRDFEVDLAEGWNSLQALLPVMVGACEFYLGLPADAGLSISAEEEIDSPDTFMLAGPWEGDARTRAESLALPLGSSEDLPEELGPWRLWPRDRGANSAFCERAWKTLTPIDEGSGRKPGTVDEVSGASYVDEVGEGALVLTYDFGTEVLCRPTLDFTAAAGTTVDLFYSERLAEGVPVHYNRLTVRMAERYIAREGRQTYRTFHPRGFRWLDVVVQGDLDRFHLHRLSATRANYPVENIGSFRCSDPTLNRIWDMGRETQFACMEDAYLDCPRRERGSYPGDNLVQFYTVLAAFGDTQLMRRSVEQAFLSQDGSGLLSHCAHSPFQGRHPDYSAITVQTLWHYYARTGDEAFLREMKPRMVRVLEAIEEFEVPGTDILDGSHLLPYLDISRLDREGASCALNCFYQRAFHDGARVMRVIGDAEAAEAYEERAERLAAAIRKEFWDPELNVFLDRRRYEEPETEPSAPGNILPLLYDIAGEAQVPGALDYVVDAMANNFRVPEPTDRSDYNVSCYFSFYGLDVLYRYGRENVAADYIRTYWGRMLDRGAWTCWENMTGGGSVCHAWASSPTHFMSSRVLGVRFPEAGNPNVVRIAPQRGSLSWAEGVYPHPAGPIHVRWEVRAGELVLACAVPQGVEVETAREV